MALIRAGQGVTDIRGGFGGVYFSRDKSGLHCTAKPRRVHQRTEHQDRKRKAFTRARAFCLKKIHFVDPCYSINCCVSYNIFRAYLDLPMKAPPVDYPRVK